MIRRLLCWLGFHKWHVYLKSGWARILKTVEEIGCPISITETFIYEERCKYQGKPIKSPVFIDKDRGEGSGYPRKDIGKHRGIAGYRRRTITNKGTKIIIE